MNQHRQQPPKNFKEGIGYLIYKVVIPIASAYLVYGFIAENDFDPRFSIPIGMVCWYFWFRPVFVYLFAPVWNSLYVPCPYSPEDDGTMFCDVYLSEDTNDKFIKGIVGEFIPYSQKSYMTTESMWSYLKDNSLNKKRLKKVGNIEIEYFFESYKSNVHYMSPIFRRGPIKYKYPIYHYLIKSEASEIEWPSNYPLRSE